MNKEAIIELKPLCFDKVMDFQVLQDQSTNRKSGKAFTHMGQAQEKWQKFFLEFPWVTVLLILNCINEERGLKK